MGLLHLVVDNSLLFRLRACVEDLPDELHDEIVARGRTMVPRLVTILENYNDDAQENLDTDTWWAPVHAVDLLADLKATEAIQPMLQILPETECGDFLHDRIVNRLPDFGAAVLEPALAMLGPDADPELLFSLCGVLSSLGTRDERIYRAICKAFEEDQMVGADAFAEYGDARALPSLAGAIGCFVATSTADAAVLGDLVAAYEDLGGRLSERLQAHVQAVFAEWVEPEDG